MPRMKNGSSAPSSSPRSKSGAFSRKVRENQGRFDRSASLGDDGPTRKSSAPATSLRPKSAAPARAVRAGQALLDRSARLGDSGPKSMAAKGKSSGGPRSSGISSVAKGMAPSASPRPRPMPARPQNTGPENTGPQAMAQSQMDQKKSSMAPRMGLSPGPTTQTTARSMAAKGTPQAIQRPISPTSALGGTGSGPMTQTAARSMAAMGAPQSVMKMPGYKKGGSVGCKTY